MADFFIWEINPLSNITLIDIIDISIITFVIYKVAIWLRNTRARSLFKGILVVLIIYGLSFFLGLRAIYWLTDSFFNIGIIAMLIVFQPELRKMLEEIGRGKFGPKLMESDEETQNQNTISEIVKAVEYMAKEKTGVLIIMERENSLNDIEKTGILLDANITSQLLISLFDHHTPLHDGAVLIKNNRIAAASCILPLTENEIGKDLGTRHRAAVGVSEANDSLSIIVSEETGNISIAHKGNLTKGINGEKLAKVILGSAKSAQRKKLVLWSSGKNVI